MTQIFIDGDFDSGIGNCKHHCSPTCHPGQIDENNWHYGCRHPAWPQNQEGDFVPFVECNGDRRKCEIKKLIRALQKTIEIYEKEENK
jgi:hypothetical protein